MSLLAALASGLLALSAAKGGDEWLREDLIHSDLPLWAPGDDGVWPRSVDDADGFGCATTLSPGDWRFERNGLNEEPTWYRLGNNGILHCFMLIRQAGERAALKGGASDFGFLIRLGTAPVRGGTQELWAIQRGARPGSTYLLLARKPVRGLIKEFEVLQTVCPAGLVREGRSLDVMSTRYCAVNSRQRLISMARQMSRLPALGHLIFEPPVEGGEE